MRATTAPIRSVSDVDDDGDTPKKDWRSAAIQDCFALLSYEEKLWLLEEARKMRRRRMH